MKKSGRLSKSLEVLDQQETVHLAPLRMLQNVINQDFDRFLSRFGASASAPLFMPFGGFSPSVNVTQKDNVVHVQVELPGMTEEDVQVSLQDNVLTIQGERKLDEEVQERQMYRREFSYGTFRRSISVPGSPDPDQVKASFNNGILSIDLPVTEKKQPPPARIPIAPV